MNTEHVAEDALNMHFDGELEPEQAGAVTRHLASCAECNKRLHSLGKLRELITMSATDAAGEIDFDAMFGKVEKATRAQPAASWSERAVVWVRETLDYQPAKLWVPAGMALAAAGALVVVMTRTQPTENEAGRSPPRDDRQEAPMMIAEKDPAPVPPEELAPPAASEVVQVDFGSNTGTVFEIALADGASTPVVWINDEE